MNAHLLVAVGIVGMLPLVAAAAPGIVHQGRLLSTQGAPVEGSRSLTFKLYTAASGGSPIWQETDVSVPVADGYFSTILGDSTALDALDWGNTPYWLAVAVDGGTDLSPRTPIGAVPFALVAGNANGGVVQPPITPTGDCDGTAASVGRMRYNDTTQWLQACALTGTWKDIVFVGSELYTFTSHAFNTCGQTGRTGPNLTQCTGTYATTWDGNPAYFGMSTNGIQRWTVPANATYRIQACGAVGGSNNQGTTYPGRGTCMQGDVALAQGDVLQILVGQAGALGVYVGGGGGGSFVVKSDGTPLVIGGGGAGSSRTQDARSSYTDATTATAGRNGVGSSGGTGGNGGGVSSAGNRSGAGGGLLTSGANGATAGTVSEGGGGFLQGGVGGNCGDCQYAGVGGFGGGAGGYHAEAPGGGGGYSGGGGGQNPSGPQGTWDAGGGGSYNSGTNASNSGGSNGGAGTVTITRL